MTPYERFALTEYLADFPNDKSYGEILRALVAGQNRYDDEILVWEAVEHYPREDLANIIDSLKESLELHFVPREELLQ